MLSVLGDANMVCTIVAGVTISSLRKQDRDFFLNMLTAVKNMTMKVTSFLIYLTPLAVCSSVAGEVLRMYIVDCDGLNLELLGRYLSAQIGALLIHGLLVLPLAYGITIEITL